MDFARYEKKHAELTLAGEARRASTFRSNLRQSAREKGIMDLPAWLTKRPPTKNPRPRSSPALAASFNRVSGVSHDSKESSGSIPERGSTTPLRIPTWARAWRTAPEGARRYRVVGVSLGGGVLLSEWDPQKLERVDVRVGFDEPRDWDSLKWKPRAREQDTARVRFLSSHRRAS